VKGFLLLFVGAAVFDAHRGGQMEAFDGLANTCHGAAQVRAFEAAGDHDQPLQVFAANLILRGNC